MSSSDVTREGIEGARPDRDATVGVNAGREGRRRGGEMSMVPDAKFRSYYGQPIINKPVWEAPDIPGYIYLGGLAGAASVIAAGADLTRRPRLAAASKVGAFGAISLGMVGLVHDLGRPGRFVNMLRVLKPTSPMNLGSWLLSAYTPATAVAAASCVTGRLRPLGAAATAGAAATGPLVTAYTAALICDTAVPAWHDGYREMPFLFVGSGASAAGGLGMLAASPAEAAPARLAAVGGAALELAAAKLMEKRLGEIAEPYHKHKSGLLMRAGEVLTAAGLVGTLLTARRSRSAATLSGAALMLASAFTRWGIFTAGIASAQNPEHTVKPQRERLDQGQPARAPAVTR